MIEAIPKRKVSGWILDEMPGLLTDNIISMDDRFMYVSLWLHGEVRQYNIEDRSKPKLVGKVVIGGLLHNQSKIKVEDPDFVSLFKIMSFQFKSYFQVGYDQTVIKGKTIHGGPHSLQLSLDGKRLYTATAINTPWDEQFYPQMVK